MPATIYTDSVVTRLQDNGDGGYTLYAYNSEDELIADHPKADEMTPKLRRGILTENDPYENGYIDSNIIQLKMVNGRPVLAAPLSFHLESNIMKRHTSKPKNSMPFAP